MSRARKLANLAGTVLPLVGLVVAIALLWDRMVGPRELVILLVGYVVAGIGITVGYHRKHHQFSDQSGDPHSPHAGYGEGVIEAIKGLWHAHTGWLFDDEATAERNRYAKDLIDDKGLKLIARLFVPIVLLSLVIPGLVGWAWIGGRYGFLAGLVWGGAVRV